MKTLDKIRLNDERGMASIIVTIVLIIVMTLVVLSMSQNSITEQRQALDRQLSDQAFYNAESGINDWANWLYNNPGAKVEKTSCDVSSDFPNAPDSQVGPDESNGYTCILYDKAPSSIIFNQLDPSDGKTVGITPNIDMERLVFSWAAPGVNDNVTNTSGCNLTPSSLLPAAMPVDCNLPILKVNLIDPNQGNRDGLINNSFIGYFLPGNAASGASINISSGKGGTSPQNSNQGVMGVAHCVNNEGCSLTVNLSSLDDGHLPATETLVLRLKTTYLPGDIEITGYDTNGNKVRFINSQILIDSTGKSNDVLRRVQVRLPASNQYTGLDFTLRSVDSICKLITVNKDAGTASLGTSAQCQYP